MAPRQKWRKPDVSVIPLNAPGTTWEERDERDVKEEGVVCCVAISFKLKHFLLEGGGRRDHR